MGPDGPVKSTDKSLLDLSAYTNGWEIRKDRGSFLEVASALHPGRLYLARAADGSITVEWPDPRLGEELRRFFPSHVSTDLRSAHLPRRDQLDALLTRAAGIDRSLPNHTAARLPEALDRELEVIDDFSTETRRLTKQRIGQNLFREALLDYWGGACAVTGISQPELLRASHSTPWAECKTDEDRLNVFNGFLLVAHLDALYDAGLLSFQSDGKVIFSPALAPDLFDRLPLQNLRLRWITPDHLHFIRTPEWGS